MQLQRFENPQAFYECVESFLLAHEDINGLPLGLASTLIEDPHHYGDEDPYLAAVIDQDAVIVVAV